MIVVDTNIIAYMTFKTEVSKSVENLHDYDPVWDAPVLWKSEFLNVLAAYFRKKLLLKNEMIDALEFAEKLVEDRIHFVPGSDVINLVSRSQCSSYDCEFVALALNLNTRLITYDKRILSEFPDIAAKPEDYLSLNK
jgi:predicted nucleic acid-binding protein